MLNTLLGMVGPWQLAMVLIFVPLFYGIPVILCVERAKKLNQNQILWGVLGFFLSYIAVLIAYVQSVEDTKQCPYCGEKVLATAKKCKHCSEWLSRQVN